MASGNWFQQAVRRSPLRGRRQIFTLTLLGLFMALVIGALYLSNVADTSQTGRRLENLLAQRDQLEQTNERLRVEIAELRSVPRLIARAEELGFRNATANEVEYLIVRGYNPLRERTVAPIREDEAQQYQYDETFMGWLEQRFDDLSRQFNDFNSLSGDS
jgi:cell division protein FtsL